MLLDIVLRVGLQLILYIVGEFKTKIRQNVTMSQLNQLPLETVIKNLADSVAVHFHLLSKKSIKLMKQKLQNDEQKRLKKRQLVLDKYRALHSGHSPTHISSTLPTSPVPTQPQKSAIGTEEAPEEEESRLARINRIKEAMLTKKIELDLPNEQRQQGEQVNIMEKAFQQFSDQLRPQILNKYPSAQPEKVNKVILQKWNTFQPAKKEAYLKKVKRRLELSRKKLQATDKMETEAHTENEPNHPRETEVKRQENYDSQLQSKQEKRNPHGQQLNVVNDPDSQHFLPHNRSNYASQQLLPKNESNRVQQKQENGSEYKTIESGTVMQEESGTVMQEESVSGMPEESEMSNSPESQTAVKQKYEPNIQYTS